MSSRKSRRIPLDLGALSGRQDLFLLNGAVRHDAAIDVWLGGDPIELRLIAKKWFMQMRQCGEDVRELMHDGCPVACVEDAPFAYVNTFKSHVNVGFFCGAMLDDPAGLLDGSGKRMRHVKLSPDEPLNVAALNKLISIAYVDIKLRLDAKRSGND